MDKFKTGLASIVDVWNQVSKDIQSDKALRDKIISDLGTDGLEELTSSLHDELGDLVSEIDGVYNVAHTYRKNYFIALLDNMDRYLTVQQQLTEYQGYSQEENAKYMETYTAKVNQLNDAWQKLANDEQGLLGMKKSLVEMGISLIDLVDNGGGLVAVLTEISTIVISVVTFLASARLAEKTLSLVETGKLMVQTVRNLAGGTREAMTAAQGLQAAFGWISLAVTIGTALIGVIKGIAASNENAREETIALGKETANNAKQIAELRKEQLKLNPDSEEYRKIESQIVELLGEKKVLLEDMIPVTEAYRDKVKELTKAELDHAVTVARSAKAAAAKSAKADFDWSARFDLGGIGIEDADIFRTIQNAYSIEEEYKAYEQVVQRIKELESEIARADASNDEKLANSLEKRLAVLQKFVNNTKDSMEEYATSIQNYNDVSRAYLDQSIEGMTASMKKVPATARKSQAELQAIAEENGMTLEEVRAMYENVGQGIAETVEEIPEEVRDALEMTDAELEEHLNKVSGAVGVYSAAADAIDLVTKAQAEYAENGQLSLDTVEKLSKLGADWVTVLFDENGAVDVNSEAVGYLVGKYEELLENSGYLIDTTTQVTEKMKDLSAQIDDVQSAISVLDEAQKEYDETGSLSIDTLQKLLGLGSEYLALIINEEGQVRLNEDAVNDLVAAKKELLDQLIAQQVEEYAVNKLHEYMSKSTEAMGDEAALAAGKIELAALALAHFEGNEEGAKRAAEDFEEALHRLALSEGAYFEDWEEDWVSDVKNFRSGLTSLYSSTNTSSSGWRSTSSKSSSSSSKSTKDEYLETLKSAVSLRESELTLMEHQGASQDEQIAKMRQIQSAIHDEAEYMRSIGASQEEINKLSSDWWKWEEKINKFAEDNAKAAEKAAEEQKKAAEEAKKAAEEAQKAETARLKQVLSDDKARLTLMEKQGKSVSERVEKMKEIQAHLHDEAEWLRQIGAEQSEIDALSAEWWDWQEKILKLYQETLDAQKQIELDAIQKTIDGILKEIDLEEEALEIEEKRLAVDDQRRKLEEAIRDAKIDYIQSVLSDYITALSNAETLEEKQRAVAEAREKLVQAEREAQAKSIIDAFKAEKDLKSDVLSLDEKRLAVEQARQALIDAENNRTTRVYNEASGQWEYQANAKDVQSAKDSLKSAVDALNAYVEEAAWNEVAEAVENGSVSEAEVLEILEKWAKESYGNDSPEFVSKIQTAFRKAMGTAASPDSVSGQISAVDSAVKSLNEYLKQEAVKELKSYIAAGNTDAAGMRSILDKWLSMGEGSELYSWRDGLLSTVTSAIRSGYYDDSKVLSQEKAVEKAVQSLHDYLRNRFIREIEDIVKNGTADQITAAIDKWSKEFDLSDTDRDWAERLYGAKSQYENTEQFWNNVSTGNLSDDDKRAIVQRMKANSEEWWTADEARKRELADLNYYLGTSMGWRRKDDGAWYDEYDRRLYDKGGVLRGRGGIKGTDRPEIVLDPELTSQILKPGSDAQFKAFADALHLMFERGGRRADDKPVIRNPAVTDSHNTSYTVNGIPIGESMAERYTIAELFRTMPLVGAN